MNIPSWVYAVALSVPMAVGGTVAVQTIYIKEPQVVQPVVHVDIDEAAIADRIVDGQDRKARELQAEHKAAADKAFCKSVRGWPGMEATGACP